MGNLGVNEAMNLSETTGGQNVSVMAEAVSALTNLGYSRTEAGLAVSAVMRQNPEASVSDAIRLSLREIGKGAV